MMSVAFRSIFLFIYTVSQVTCTGRNKSENREGWYILSGLTCHMCRCPVPGRPHQAEGDDACGQHLQVPVSCTVCRAPVQSCLQGGASADSSDLDTIPLHFCPELPGLSPAEAELRHVRHSVQLHRGQRLHPVWRRTQDEVGVNHRVPQI